MSSPLNIALSPTSWSNAREFAAPNLLQIAMPMGGIGAGCICLNGYGGIQDFSVRNRPDTSAIPDGHHETDSAFALLHVAKSAGFDPITLLVEGPLPPEKLFDQGLKGQGYRQGGHEGLPRFEANDFQARYPFGRVRLYDSRMPISVSITGWSPLIPGDDVNSGMPSAFLEYDFTNRGSERITFEFSYHLSHMAHAGSQWEKTQNSLLGPVSKVGRGVSLTNSLASYEENKGSAALYCVGHSTRVKAMWFRGGWFDAVSMIWHEAANSRFTLNDGSQGQTLGGRNGGSIIVSLSLDPGETITIPIIIAWHFPNVNITSGQREGNALLVPAWSPFYAGKWKDAAEVALYAASNYNELRKRTVAFADALHDSSLPKDALDAVASNLAILKSPTVLRQKNGNVWGWEGCFCAGGCCPGSCTHVWNYAQCLPHLFPALERTLREQELERSMNDLGHVTFRAALPDNPPDHGFHAAADGQLGGILKLYRDYSISGDRSWLNRMYPLAKRSMEYAIQTWDPDRRGLLFEPHHNTYDIEFWGPDGMCSSIYVGALCAMAEMSRILSNDHDASAYEAAAVSGAKLMDELLFNGEYYQQKVSWTDLHDNSFANRIESANESERASELYALESAEGPKYQYGAGCLSDGVIGAWMARLYGIQTPIDPEHLRSTLRAIYKYNFREDLSQHACTQRPGYANGHEAGLLLCTWPRGEKLTLPFPYSDEVWTGIEYQVASHMILEGMTDEALAIVSGVRRRYDGRTRNPFNEYECGNYYARAMASYALLTALSGFRYTAADRTLRFRPKYSASHFRCLFSTDGAYGTISLDNHRVTVNVIEGQLALNRLILSEGDVLREIPWSATIGPGEQQSVT